jgi:RNA-directed DNA polymerase
MTTKDRSLRPSHERSGSSPTSAGEPHDGHSSSGSAPPSRHRDGDAETGPVRDSQPKLGFMQALKAEKRARRRQAGHTRAASPRRDPKRKAHSLIDKVYRWENLLAAWKRVRANKGAHGLDRVTIRHFEADRDIHLREIQRKLKQHRYTPQPVRRVYIPKASDPTKRRPLGIPVVADRVVQQAILQVVEPIFDPELSDRSFGFRKGRKAHDAIATVIADGKEGYRHVVDADIASFFDEIGHDVAMSRIRARIADGRVLDLFDAFLKAGVMEGGVVTVPKAGTPQGGVISPWIANLVLDDLDKAIEATGWRHARYADDFVILCRSRKEAEQALATVKEVLEGLKLSLHETKTRLTDFREGFDFLGFRFHNYRLGIGSKVIERFKDKIRKLTRRHQGRNVDAVLADLNPVLRGWARYFGAGEVKQLMISLDSWIRMRLRAFRLKRKCHNDNWRLPNSRLERWGLLSLQICRPALRLSYARVRGSTRAEPGSLPRGHHAGSPSALTAHAVQMAAS